MRSGKRGDGEGECEREQRNNIIKSNLKLLKLAEKQTNELAK